MGSFRGTWIHKISQSDREYLFEMTLAGMKPTPSNHNYLSTEPKQFLDAVKKSKSGTAMDKEFSQLRISMDSKMTDLVDLENLVEKSKPAAHILENVMAELEQRNSELASLYRSSEKNRVDMEAMLKEQNEELKTLRANTSAMRSLESEVSELTDKKHDLETAIKDRDQELSTSRKQEQFLLQKVREMEREVDQAGKDFNLRVVDLTTKIAWTNDQILEKDAVIDKTEQTVKELFEKCEQLGTSNTDIKKELANSVVTNRLIDVNSKLQYCKDYLEEQLEVLIKELKNARVENEQLRLEFANLNGEKTNCAKEIVMINEELSQSSNEVRLLKESLKTIQTRLKEYESGESRSPVVINEIKKERRAFEITRDGLEKKVRELESKRDLLMDELKHATMQEKRTNTKMMEMESKIAYFQENFVEKAELQRVKADLEVKYKLDMNAQLKKVSAVFDKDQDDLIKTMRTSLAMREQMDSEMSRKSS